MTHARASPTSWRGTHVYRKNDIDRLNFLYAFTSTYPPLTWLAPTLPIADEAARLRAQYGLRTPDAIQVATTLAAGAGRQSSNDAVVGRVSELDVLLLDDALEG